MQNISNDLLANFRENRAQVEEDFFDLTETVYQFIREKNLEFQNTHKVYIEYIVRYPILGQVRVPKTLLLRVLSNLVNNSVEANSTKIQMTLEPHDQFVHLAIEDNGEGIPADKVHMIFDENISLKKGGTGLGLSSSKKHVEAWGGSISIKGSSSRGTTLELTIPYQG